MRIRTRADNSRAKFATMRIKCVCVRALSSSISKSIKLTSATRLNLLSLRLTISPTSIGGPLTAESFRISMRACFGTVDAEPAKAMLNGRLFRIDVDEIARFWMGGGKIGLNWCIMGRLERLPQSYSRSHSLECWGKKERKLIVSSAESLHLGYLSRRTRLNGR